MFSTLKNLISLLFIGFFVLFILGLVGKKYNDESTGLDPLPNKSREQIEQQLSASDISSRPAVSAIMLGSTNRLVKANKLVEMITNNPHQLDNAKKQFSTYLTSDRQGIIQDLVEAVAKRCGIKPSNDEIIDKVNSSEEFSKIAVISMQHDVHSIEYQWALRTLEASCD